MTTTSVASEEQRAKQEQQEQQERRDKDRRRTRRRIKDRKDEQASPARTRSRYQDDLRKGKTSDAAFRDQRELSSMRATEADRRALRGFKGEQWNASEKRARKLREAHPDVPDDMSDEEIVALSDYTGSHYRPMNESLRSGGEKPVKGLKMGSEFTREEALARTNCTCSALNKLPPVPPDKRTVYRGTNLPPSELAKYQKGETVADKGFTSSSTDPKVAYGGMEGKAANHRITIRHKNGKDVAKFTNHPNESEIVFPPGTKFRVVDRREGPPVEIELEEVEDDEAEQ